MYKSVDGMDIMRMQHAMPLNTKAKQLGRKRNFFCGYGTVERRRNQRSNTIVSLSSYLVLAYSAELQKRPENPFALGCSVGLSERFLFIQQIWKVYYEASPSFCNIKTLILTPPRSFSLKKYVLSLAPRLRHWDNYVV